MKFLKKNWNFQVTFKWKTSELNELQISFEVIFSQAQVKFLAATLEFSDEFQVE